MELFDPPLVTTLTTPPPLRPNCGPKLLVSTLNSCVASGVGEKAKLLFSGSITETPSTRKSFVRNRPPLIEMSDCTNSGAELSPVEAVPPCDRGLTCTPAARPTKSKMLRPRIGSPAGSVTKRLAHRRVLRLNERRLAGHGHLGSRVADLQPQVQSQPVLDAERQTVANRGLESGSGGADPISTGPQI